MLHIRTTKTNNITVGLLTIALYTTHIAIPVQLTPTDGVLFGVLLSLKAVNDDLSWPVMKVLGTESLYFLN